MIKLIAVDMDGTFLKDDQTYDEAEFAKIYQQLKARNIQFVVASGNQYFQLISFFTKYPEVIYIAENGALIRSPKQLYALHQYSEQAVKQIEQFLLDQNDIQFLVCGAQSAYELTKFGQEYYDLSTPYYYHLQKVEKLSDIHDQILKFAIRCPEDKTQYYVDLFNQKLKDYCNATSSGHGDIDLIQPGIHKAHGLAELGKILGIDLSEMCAFGDGGNDYEMLKEAGDGVAMANSAPQLLAIANHRTASNNEQGVLKYLAKLLASKS